MPQTKTQTKKTKKEIERRLKSAKTVQDGIYNHLLGNWAFHEIDLDDWSLGQIEVERNILEWDVEL